MGSTAAFSIYVAGKSDFEILKTTPDSRNCSSYRHRLDADMFKIIFSGG